MVAEEFLGPTTNLVNVTVIFKNFLHGTAVADPEEVLSDKIFATYANSPTAGSGFAHKQMVMLLAFKASAGSEFDGANTSVFKG